MKSNSSPYRAPRRNIRPVAVVVSRSQLGAIVLDLIRRIRELEKNMSGPAYLIIDRGAVYLISENASGAPAILERFVHAMVGAYDHRSTHEHLLEDIERHLEEQRFLTAATDEV